MTEIDKRSEKIILEIISSEFPGHSFVGEEGMMLVKEEEEEEKDQQDLEISSSSSSDGYYTWYVDPIDGTTNFVHSYPFIAISIGLCEEGEPIVGVIFNPVLNELYSAYKGSGAFLNQSPISCSTTLSLNQAMVVKNIGASRSDEFIEMNCSRLEGLLKRKMQVKKKGNSSFVL